MTAQNPYADFSGITTTTRNPYDALIDSCNDDPALIHERYATHREKRNAQQKQQMLDPASKQLNIDPILHKLVNKSKYPDFRDPRCCLVFWSRPPQSVKDLIHTIQSELKTIAPNLWIMPPDNLHMTTLEITHSLTEPEIQSRVEKLTPKLEEITDFTYTHRTKLIHPIVSFDSSALALSFVPAADSAYTYHHLRRELYELCESTGVTVESRYVVPSAHLTIGRYVDYKDLGDDKKGEVDAKKIQAWIERIEEINAWLKQEVWESKEVEWIVGQEKGLDCNKGYLWYGYGERVRLGRGF